MIKRVILALILLPAPASVFAQAGYTPVPGRAPHDEVIPQFEHLLFPPELVMQHRTALKLTPQQRTAISDAVKALQSQSIDVQWELQDEQKKLTDLLAQRPIPEAAAVAQVNKLIDLESSVKRAHLATLIRIKNALTTQQIEQLTALRSRWAPEDELFSTYLRTPPPGGWAPGTIPPPSEWEHLLPLEFDASTAGLRSWNDLYFQYIGARGFTPTPRAPEPPRP